MGEDLHLSRNIFQLSPVSCPFCTSETAFTFRLAAIFPSQSLRLSLLYLLLTSYLTSALLLTLFFLGFHYLALRLVFLSLQLILHPLLVSLPARYSFTLKEASMTSSDIYLHRSCLLRVKWIPLPKSAACLRRCLWVCNWRGRVQPSHLSQAQYLMHQMW